MAAEGEGVPYGGAGGLFPEFGPPSGGVEIDIFLPIRPELVGDVPREFLPEARDGGGDKAARLDERSDVGVEVLRITAEKMVGIDTDHGVEVPFGKGQGMSFGPEGDNGVFKPEVPEPRKVVRRVYPQVHGKDPYAECPCEVYRAQPHAAP